MKKGGNIIWLAIHFRDYRDPLDPDGNKHQGNWKEFLTMESAEQWLQMRICKSLTSPQGEIPLCVDLSLGKDMLNAIIIESYPNVPPNFWKAFNAWLNWKFKK